ncbi:vomeronasal type-2 receptor 26-like isoform X2 [Paroedura picta]|uniref:vomeronasal type-2 receptor 26-like isoform X2 n=1 Tax=Paroedura picta TaxID=143630 RepID=UPI004055FF34
MRRVLDMKWHLLSFSLAVQEIRQDPRLLPNNITLGYTVYENDMHPRTTYEAVLDLLPSAQETIPNYKCGTKNSVLAVLEASESEIFTDVSSLLSTYKVPQVSHGFHLEVLKDRIQFPFFHETAPKEEARYLGIVTLLLHFRWTWVGLIAQENDNGDVCRRTLTALMLRSGVCVAFSETIAERGVHLATWSRERVGRMKSVLSQDQVNVFVFYGDVPSMLLLELYIELIEYQKKVILGKVWITTIVLDSLLSLACSQVPFKSQRHGSLSVISQTKKRAKYPHTHTNVTLL